MEYYILEQLPKFQLILMSVGLIGGIGCMAVSVFLKLDRNSWVLAVGVVFLTLAVVTALLFVAEIAIGTGRVVSFLVEIASLFL